MNVLISGGGIAGLALAGFLLQQGLEPIIVEKTSQWSRVGYGISLWGNGIRILEALDLGDAFHDKGERIDEWTLRDGSGDVLAEARLDVGDLPPLTVIHRADLHAVLLEKVPEESIRMNTVVDAVERKPDGVRVQLSDGSHLLCDALIGADGIHSQVRDLVFDGWTLKDMGTAVWSFWIPPRIETPSGFTEAWQGNGKAFLVAPVAGKKMGSVGLPIDEGYDQERHLDFLRDRVHPEEWLLPEVVGALDDPETIYHDRDYHVKASRWHKGRVALVGDAAHAIHPIAGMGASLALEDAYVLANELGGASPGTVPEALRRFTNRRADRVTRFQKQAKFTKAITFTQSSVLRSSRDFIVRHTPFFERFFIDQARAVSEDLFRKL